MKKFASIDEYLDALPKDQKEALKKLHKIIKSVVPAETQEKISYGMPTFAYKGNLVHYAAFKNHLSFFPGSKRVTQMFASKLKDHVTGAATIQFTVDDHLPDSLVEAIVKERVKENTERKAKTK